MPSLLPWLPWSVPVAYAVGALAALALRAHAWAVLRAATTVALLAACALALARVGGYVVGPAPAVLVLPLVAFLGRVIGGYSQRYLAGEPDTRRYVVALAATLCSVAVVVVSGNLATLVIAWAGTSIALHHLLTFYRDRAPAIVVAHKKFIASRLAEACLAGACVLLARCWGTLDLDALATLASAARVPSAAAAAAVLIAVAVILKTAQLPMHGWLIQVMEAPTPVSALLHAGVINLGGYVCIRLASLLAHVPLASGLLVLAGGLTAAIAGIVAMTRVSVKVRLAWSTCAQMGFMLLECGLGLFDLALLHLVAHSLYKAYAFLSSGEAVRAARLRDLLAPAWTGEARGFGIWPLLALPVAWTATALSAVAWQLAFGTAALPWIATGLISIGFATLLWGGEPGLLSVMRRLGALLLAVQTYLLWHALVGRSVPAWSAPTPAPFGAFALVCLLALYATQWRVVTAPRSGFARRLYPWAYAGFYLDEWFTRLTFQLWPVQLPATTPRGAP